MIIHKVPPITLVPDVQELYLVPFGDMQGKEEQPRFKKLIEWCLHKKILGHRVKLFGLGDYFETFSPSERASLAAANKGFGFHETTMETIDEWCKAQADEIIEILEPIKEDVLGLLRGHHFYPFAFKGRGLTTDSYIAEALDAEFYGDLVLIKLLINGIPFKILAAHGYGNARTTGARINKRIAMREVYLNANWYVMGHDNEKVLAVKEPFIENDRSNDGIDYFKQYFSGSGSFQRGYRIGSTDGNYIERGLFSPAALGVVICKIGVNQRESGPRLDYHVSM